MNNEFYEAVKHLVNNQSNNMKLGESIREFINSKETLNNTKDVIKKDKNQVTILEDIARYGNRS
jgi:hypothetical protein